MRLGGRSRDSTRILVGLVALPLVATTAPGVLLATPTAHAQRHGVLSKWRSESSHDGQLNGSRAIPTNNADVVGEHNKRSEKLAKVMFSLGKLTLNTNKGVGRLTIRVSAPGRVVLRNNRQVKRAAREFGAAGRGTLKVRPRGKAARRMSRSRCERRSKRWLRTRVTAKVTYSPIEGPSRSRQRTLRLARRCIPPPAPDGEPPVILGTLGGADSHAFAANSYGLIVGSSTTAENIGTHAFVYDSATGVMTDLGTLGGGNSTAHDVNDAGLVVGASDLADGGAAHAFIYDLATGTMTDIGTLGGTDSVAHAVNDDGLVVGFSDVAGDTAIHAFAYDPAAKAMADLGTLGGTSSAAYDVNDEGFVVGESDLAGDLGSHAFVLDPTTMNMRSLGTLGGVSSTAYAINAAGTVVGASDVVAGVSGYQAFTYDLTMDVMTPVAGLGGRYSTAYGIHDDGRVVGQSSTVAEDADLAYVFDPVQGDDSALPTLGGAMAVAESISANGTIVGAASTRGGARIRAVVFSPADSGEPVSNVEDEFDDGGTTPRDTALRSVGHRAAACDCATAEAALNDAHTRFARAKAAEDVARAQWRSERPALEAIVAAARAAVPPDAVETIERFDKVNSAALAAATALRDHSLEMLRNTPGGTLLDLFSSLWYRGARSNLLDAYRFGSGTERERVSRTDRAVRWAKRTLSHVNAGLLVRDLLRLYELYDKAVDLDAEAQRLEGLARDARWALAQVQEAEHALEEARQRLEDAEADTDAAAVALQDAERSFAACQRVRERECAPPPDARCAADEVEDFDGLCLPRYADGLGWRTVVRGGPPELLPTPALACERQRESWVPNATPLPPTPDPIRWWVFACDWEGGALLPSLVFFECPVDYVIRETPGICIHWLADI